MNQAQLISSRHTTLPWHACVHSLTLLQGPQSPPPPTGPVPCCYSLIFHGQLKRVCHVLMIPEHSMSLLFLIQHHNKGEALIPIEGFWLSEAALARRLLGKGESPREGTMLSPVMLPALPHFNSLPSKTKQSHKHKVYWALLTLQLFEAPLQLVVVVGSLSGVARAGTTGASERRGRAGPGGQGPGRERPRGNMSGGQRAR